MGRHLDIDFCAILVDLGSQVGKENETKIKIKKGQNLKGFLVGGGAGHVGEEFSPSLVGGILWTCGVFGRSAAAEARSRTGAQGSAQRLQAPKPLYL